MSYVQYCTYFNMYVMIKMKDASRLYRNEHFPISLRGYTGLLWTRYLITIYILECPYSISGTVLCAIIKNCLLHPWFSFLWSVIRWRKADPLSVIYALQYVIMGWLCASRLSPIIWHFCKQNNYKGTREIKVIDGTWCCVYL